MNNKSIIILFIQGGAGDVLAHTPMIRSMRKGYPDDHIIVISTYKQLLENNPHIDTLLSLKEPKDFYSEYVLNKNVRFFKKHFIYDSIMDVPARNCTSLPEFICEVYDVEYDNGPLDYFVTDYEERAAKTFLAQSLKQNKKVILLHISGAVPSDGGYQVMMCGVCNGRGFVGDSKCSACGGSGKIVIMEKTNILKDLDVNVVASVIEKYKDRFHFLQIGLEGEPIVPGSFDCLGMSMRDTIALIPLSASYIFIESLFAHCTNALNTAGVVVFQNTSKDFFGYKNNYNISNSPDQCKCMPCNRPVGALLDLAAGYKDPKTKKTMLWECDIHDTEKGCKFKSPDVLIDTFEKSLFGRPPNDGGFNDLRELRKCETKKPKLKKKVKKNIKEKS